MRNKAPPDMFNNPFWTSTNVASTPRASAIKLIIVLLFVGYSARLVQLQVLEFGAYEDRSQAQTIKKLNITPIRGVMYDRNGKLLVHNIASFAVTLTPSEFRPECLPLVCRLLAIDSSRISEILRKNRHASQFTPIKIMRDVPPDIVASLTEVIDRLYGIDIVIDSKRTYTFGCNMAHLIGYAREISERQLARYQYYKPGDVVGQEGLEQSYEAFLHGRDGINFIAIDKVGQKIESFIHTDKSIPAASGLDLTLSIDIELQEYAEQLLASSRGAVVAIDPNNGEVLTFCSKPDFDPRLFSGRVPVEVYNQLSTDKALPLFPRALRSEYPPGSTWKMLIALAALQEGLITEHTIIPCHGGFTFGGRTWKCHGCGAVNVRNALRSSCNTFFCSLGVRLGMERFEEYGSMFNFGRRTQIDLPAEARGLLPSRKWWQKRDSKVTNFSGLLANYGIGQGEILVTPLQMAAYVAALANEGTYYQPHIVRSAYNASTKATDNFNYDSKPIPIDKKHFKTVKDGMWRVVNGGGTGAVAQIPGYDVCGKTGTAENARKDHSWFVCFAPKDNPQIAMCVFVENGGFGAASAAPIAHKLLRKFFKVELPEVVVPGEEEPKTDIQVTVND